MDCDVDAWRMIPGRSSHARLKKISAVVARVGDQLTFATTGPAGDAAAAEAHALLGLGINATALAVSLPTATIGDADVAARIEEFVGSSAERMSTRAGVGRAALYGLFVLLIFAVELVSTRLTRLTLALDPAQNLLTLTSFGGRVTRFELDAVADVEVEHQELGVHRAVLVLVDGRRVALGTTFHRGDQHHAFVDALRPHLRRR